tara:strand:+ start:184 stop:1059 length:876 start_codon:yes stop_codon:yes gene_type:complete
MSNITAVKAAPAAPAAPAPIKGKKVDVAKVTMKAADKAKAAKADKVAKAKAADKAKALATKAAKAAAVIKAKADKVADIEAKALAAVAADKLNDTENYNKAIKLVPVKEMKATANLYDNATKAAAANLMLLKDLGEQFNLIKNEFTVGLNAKGEPTYNDQAFSRCINATPLSVVSRRDRSDCVWLHLNWSAIQTFKSEGIESNSVSYLRTLLTKANKPKPTPKGPKNEAADSDAIEGEFELVDGEATPKQAQTIESLVVTIQGLVNASDHSMEAVLAQLLAGSTTVKLVTK